MDCLFPITIGFIGGVVFMIAVGLFLTRGPGSPDWTGYEDD